MLDEDDEDGDLFRLEGKASEAEEHGPRVDIPSVRDPSESLPDPSDVDPAVQRSFWMAVIYANVALMGVSLGLMLIGFRGQWRWGGIGVGVGILAGIRVYQTYRDFKNRDSDDDTVDSGAVGDSEGHERVNKTDADPGGNADSDTVSAQDDG